MTHAHAKKYHYGFKAETEVERQKEVLFFETEQFYHKDCQRPFVQVIADRVNGIQDGVCRTAEDVRKKWSNVASDFKTREALQRREYKKTGGASC